MSDRKIAEAARVTNWHEQRKARRPVRCACGRFAKWDGYYGRWWCDLCERRVDPKVAR